VITLQEPHEEVQRIKDLANELMSIASRLEGDQENTAMRDSEDDEGARYMLGELARQEYRQRRLRTLIFGDESLFGEPAWDMLLDLFIAEQQGTRLAITSVCIGAAVPASTALRWISVLEHKGLVYRDDDASDGRRSFIRLTPKGHARMIQYFDRIRRPGPFAGDDEEAGGLIAKTKSRR